ncbi:MAG: sigma-70 family RNA polymerase sigma factor [Planctomycetota bacterium]
MADSFDDLGPADLLRRTAWLQGLAREIVADRDAASDITQDTWVEALRNRNRVQRLAPWLAQVARHFALRHRRRESDRSARERSAARAEALPSTADVVARAQQQHRIAAAVLALDEPHRSIVLMRFFDGLPPRAIAARTGLPIATVHTRLRRALERLRDKLDAEFGDRRTWLTVILPLAAMKTKLSLLSVTLIATLTWFALTWDRPKDSTPPVSRDTELAQIEQSRTPGSAAAAATSAGGTAELAPRNPVAADTLVPMIRVIGRCVRQDSEVALRGVHVTVIGRAPTVPTAGRASASFAPPPPTTTGDDGRFDLSFPAVDGHSFQVTLQFGDYVPMTSGEVTMRGAAEHDCGDIALRLGCRVEGRVVDEDGRPVAHETLLIATPNSVVVGPWNAQPTLGDVTEPPGLRVFEASEVGRATTAADGRFAFTEPKAPREWKLAILPRRRIVQGATLSVMPGKATQWVDVIAERAIGELSGIVADDLGQPVPESRVKFALSSGEEQMLTTDSEGRFVLLRFARDVEDAVRLRASRRGYESPPETTHRFESGVRLLLLRTATVVVNVKDPTGRPIESFGVRCFEDVAEGNLTTNDTLLRHVGRHEHGRCEYGGLRLGPHWVRIEAADDQHAASWLHGIDLRERRPYELDVTLHPPASREIEVVDSNEAPVAGVEVRLVRSFRDAAVTPHTRLIEGPLWSSVRMHDALVLDRGVTDARGVVVVRATPMTNVVLRVGTERVCRAVIPEVELRDGLPRIRVVLPAAARIEGRVSPAQALAELDATISIARLDPASPDAWGEEIASVHVDADGRFVVTSVPEGSCKLQLSDPVNGTVSLQTIEGLIAGETRSVELDLTPWMPATIRGVVRIDGGLRPTIASVIGRRHSTAATGVARTIFGGVEVASDGSFSLRVPGGAYRLRLSAEAADGSMECAMESAEEFQVLPGATITQHFEFTRRQVTVRVLDPDGQPLPGRPLILRWNDDFWPDRGVTTNGDGVAVIDPAPPTAFRIAVWPPELSSRQSKQEHMERHPSDWLDRLWNSAPISPDGRDVVDVRLTQAH